MYGAAKRASHLASSAQVDLGRAADSHEGGVVAGNDPHPVDGVAEGSLPSSDAHATSEGAAARLPAPEPRYDAEDSSRHVRHPDNELPHQAAAEDRRNGVTSEDDSEARQHRYAMHVTCSTARVHRTLSTLPTPAASTLVACTHHYRCRNNHWLTA